MMCIILARGLKAGHLIDALLAIGRTWRRRFLQAMPRQAKRLPTEVVVLRGKKEP